MSYILIADSGSTKTDWVLSQKGVSIRECKTQGMNPYQNSYEELVAIIQFEVLPFLAVNTIDSADLSIYFYGAGCHSDEMKALLTEVLTLTIPVVRIEVADDMLAAARALCGNQKGIACIMGTGSNSCCYDGISITDNRPAPGFILGDEGGGSFLGKQLLIDFINDDMPVSLKEYMQLELQLSTDSIYQNVYKRKLPNRYLASFAVFVKQELEGVNQAYFEQLLHQSFQLYFDKHIIKYAADYGKVIQTVGSIGFHFKNQFSQVAQSNGYTVGKVLQSPIEGLLEYHT